MRNPALFAIPLTAILSGLSLLHENWALGGRWGSAYVVPVVRGKRSFEPSPLATWIVCGLLALAVVAATLNKRGTQMKGDTKVKL
jgi:hypothetical protein